MVQIPAVLPGKPFPLGAHWDGRGVNFAVFSEHAERLELCLFSSTKARRESRRIEFACQTEHVWHCYVPGLKPGQIYGLRAYGKYDPLQGARFNPHKLLLDPYAKAIVRGVAWHDSLFGFNVHDQVQADLTFNARDSAPYAPLAAVIDDRFDWEDDVPPNIPWSDTVIYETHVRGLTEACGKLPPAQRGTYLGLVHPHVIEHLQALGVTAVELMPVHYSVSDGHLLDRGQCNYWGYNTLGFFAPDARFCSSEQALDAVQEFKVMVKGLHAAGIEVILDVVYNHTCEGNERGPTLTFRGLDNQDYYRLQWQTPRHYTDFTGCGNSLNTQHPQVLKFIADSLRYWVSEMHVDGFRFDLATTLARAAHNYERWSGFLDILHQDPLLSRVKLIAEPWDAGDCGYQVGNFPVGWREWNDQYRDTLRSFWKGDHGLLGRLATAVSGSSNLYQWQRRSATTSVNYITCHDGFTLSDLVSYNHKHNKANGENNCDGTDNNISWNCGVEGPTTQPKIRKLREQQKKNMLASLFLSVGVPMLSGGDELGRTQRGNNNAYCHDDKSAWYDWRKSKEKNDLLEFIRTLAEVRRSAPALRREHFFGGLIDARLNMKDISWHAPTGQEMTAEHWHDAQLCSLGVLYAGTLNEVSGRADQTGDTLFFVLNAAGKDVHFVLPRALAGSSLELVFDTALDPSVQRKKIPRSRRSCQVKAHSSLLIRRRDRGIVK